MEDRISTTIPTWLNDGFLKMVLSTEDSNIDIISCKIEDESEVNGRCAMYKVFVELMRDGQKENNYLIAKAAEDNCKTNRSEKSLIKEVNAYTLLILRMHKILEKLHLQFAPKTYYIHNGPGEVLVHEDLEAIGFRHAVPSSGLNMRNCILVIRKLAHYHASSVVIHKKHPDVMASFKTSTYSDDSRESLEKIFPPFLKMLAKEVQSWPDYKERFALKLYNLANSAVDKICECVTTRESDFNVLCHEELCLQNIVFGYSENAAEIDDIRFLEYRSVHWGSPALDFYRFLHSCAAPEVLEWSQILVEEYYSVLEETLKLLGYPQLCPPIAHFYSQFDKRVMFGLIMGLVDRAVLLADSDSISYSDKDTKNLLGIEFNDRYKNVMKKILVVLQMKGWL